MIYNSATRLSLDSVFDNQDSVTDYLLTSAISSKEKAFQSVYQLLPISIHPWLSGEHWRAPTEKQENEKGSIRSIRLADIIRKTAKMSDAYERESYVILPSFCSEWKEKRKNRRKTQGEIAWLTLFFNTDKTMPSSTLWRKKPRLWSQLQLIYTIMHEITKHLTILYDHYTCAPLVVVLS